jgi:hypothetical protein
MKKIAFFGVILVLLVATAVPVLAKSPDKTNGNSGKAQNVTVPLSSVEQEQERQQVQDQNQQHGMQQSQIHNQNKFEENNQNGMGVGNQGQSSRMRTPFYLQGTITSTDAGLQTITVSVYHANAQLKASMGMTLTLQASDTTLIYQIMQGYGGESNTSSRVAIPFDQLLVNDIVAIHGNMVDGVYQATLVTVYSMGIGGLTNSQP